MKHLGQYSSRAFFRVIKWLSEELRKRGEKNMTLFIEICCKIKGV
jgi:hypothetical protein